MFQRPQHLALALARQGALVLYLQSRFSLFERQFRKLAERTYLCNLPPAACADIPSPTVYCLSWNSEYIQSFKSPRILYDYIDEIAVFDGERQQIAQGHAQLLEKADIITVTATRLYKQIQSLRPDAILCPNAVDYPHFARARSREQIPPPNDLAPILATGKPIVGYYGALARWLDYELLTQVANLKPDYFFVLIGPDHDGTLHGQPLFQLSNVRWLGTKTYEALPDYLHYWDIAIIPFILNEITHATSPLKLFEYMASGKPVVITPMQESMSYPNVLVGATPQEFAHQLDQAMLLRSNKEYLGVIDLVARENTWDVRAAQLMQALSASRTQSQTPK
ncbi:MAG: glycosyltransferase [Chloroflexota bacterium]